MELLTGDPMRYMNNKRRGVAAVIAMLYLVLFSSLAVGFAAATNTAVQVARNDNLAHRAMLAAESGLDFVTAHLRRVSIPHRTKAEDLLDEVYIDLSDAMDGTPNVGGGDIVVLDDVIHIPAPGRFVELPGGGARFHATIQQVGTQLRVRVAGVYETAVVSARGIQLDFAVDERLPPVLDYGIAARGPIITSGGSEIRGHKDPTKGSLLSASTSSTPVSLGGKEVSGDVFITNPDGHVPVRGSVGGTNDPSEIQDHVHKGIDEPDFPTIDADVFLPFVTTDGGQKRYWSGSGPVENVVIRAGTNPKFEGGTLSGIIYVESPNTITFRGGTTVKGIIVTENNPKGNLTSNVLDFSGNTTSTSVKDLRRSDVPSLSNDQYEQLKKMTGSFVLAQGFHVSFTGSFDAPLSGSILAHQVSFKGSVDALINGSIIALTPAPLTIGGSSRLMMGDRAPGKPAGVFFEERYIPLAETYEEFKPNIAKRGNGGNGLAGLGDFDQLFGDLPAFAVEDLTGHFEGPPYPQQDSHAVPEPGLGLGLLGLALVLTRRPGRR